LRELRDFWSYTSQAGRSESQAEASATQQESLGTLPTAQDNNKPDSQQYPTIENQQGAGSKLQQGKTRPGLKGCSST
jgi:hypothetical protein